MTAVKLNGNIKTKPFNRTMEEFEKARMSRREALRKIGITGGMTLFGLFGVDDITREIGKALKRRHMDHVVVNQVAREFQRSGVVFASTFGPSGDACDQTLWGEKSGNDACISCAEEIYKACIAGCPGESRCDLLRSALTNICDTTDTKYQWEKFVSTLNKDTAPAACAGW